MGQPFVGEIRMFGGSFAPAGWMFCGGQLLPISENETLFNLIGTTYGGDGQQTFALPDLQGRTPVHAGTGPGGTTYQLGEKAGVESVTLSVQQIPAHSHPLLATTNAADTPNVANAVCATGTVSQLYWGDPPDTAASPQAISPSGGSQPHDNIQPYLTISYIISLFGVFPSQN